MSQTFYRKELVSSGQVLSNINYFDYFEFTVKTDNTGTSSNDQFTVPTVSSGTYNSYVDWGDGSPIEYITTYNDAKWTHTFTGGTGTYTIRIYRTFSGWAFNNLGDPQKLTGISQVGIFDHGNADGAFYGCSNLTTIAATDKPLIKDGSTSIVGFFRSTGITTADWSLYDFSAITDATNFLNGVTLTDDNYESLIAVLFSQNLQSSVAWHFGNSKWKFGTAGQNKYELISTYTLTWLDGGQFDPTLGVWLNPHNLLKSSPNPSNASSVSDWEDLSDNNNAASNATGTEQPIFYTDIENGEPMVDFDKVDDLLDISNDPSMEDMFGSGGFFVCVIKPESDGENNLGRIFSQGGSFNFVSLNNQSGSTCNLRFNKNFDTTGGEWESSNPDININEINIIGIYYDASDVSNDPVFYINSTSSVSVSETTAPVGTSLQGGDITVGNAPIQNKTFDGYFGDFAVFKGKNPSESERNEIFEYLSDKYGVTLS